MRGGHPDPCGHTRRGDHRLLDILLLAYHPRDASAGALRALQQAGWSETDIVILSQLASFLSFQIRVVAGLRVLAARPAPQAAHQPNTLQAQP